MDAKIVLSGRETRMVKDAKVILTKNDIMKKVIQLFNSLQENYHAYCTTDFNPKISKGENYKGFPWVVLDYPRNFRSGNFSSIRTMFWWGHYFSITLHVSGQYKEKAGEKLKHHFESMRKDDYFIFAGDDQWEHDLGSKNYLSMKKLNREKLDAIIVNRPFIKVAAKYPLEDWQKVQRRLTKRFKLLLSLMYESDERSASFQVDEKDL
jgi:hypothetical protein